jgi:hypothetical protein
MLRSTLLLAFLVAACSSSSLLESMAGLDTEQMITLEEAVTIARTEVPNGFAVEVQLEVEDDDEQESPAYEIVLYVAEDNQLMEVEVHAATGEVLEVGAQQEGEGGASEGATDRMSDTARGAKGDRTWAGWRATTAR